MLSIASALSHTRAQENSGRAVNVPIERARCLLKPTLPDRSDRVDSGMVFAISQQELISYEDRKTAAFGLSSRSRHHGAAL